MLLDTYTIGKAGRISPEAPVAIINVQHEESRPGGAGNVVLNLVSMGAEIVAIGRVGDDHAGRTLKKALEQENVDVRGLVIQSDFATPVKQRVIAENQQIVRVDYEHRMPLSEELERQVVDLLPTLLKDIALVAISDYGKGFLSQALLSTIIDSASIRGIPLIADPKGSDFAKYCGVNVIKPNLSEAYAAANLPLEASLDEVSIKILEIAQADTLMITRAEAGISLFHSDGSREDFPVSAREVKDVTGAGDTVLATLAFALANRLPLSEAVTLSNIAAGIAIERLGCARVTLAELARRLLDEDVGNKVFDAEHLFVLKQALQGRTYSLLGISGNQGLTPAMFVAIRRLVQQNDNHDVVVYLMDNPSDEEFVSMLASLHDVKFIIDQNENLCRLCELVEPEGIYIVNEKKLLKLNTLDNLLKPVAGSC
jgi:D-beta-D-heptose 7-phosphate kinase/D-beta-D-heptose 1-phosphate adenosyltransferase